MKSSEGLSREEFEKWKDFCRCYLAEHIIRLDEITFDDLAGLSRPKKGDS